MTPWTIQPLAATHGADIAICEGSDIVAVMHHDPAIQTDDDPDGSSVVWSPEALANARLMAAAPEMLAALEEMVTTLENIAAKHLTQDSMEEAGADIALFTACKLLARVRGAE